MIVALTREQRAMLLNARAYLARCSRGLEGRPGASPDELQLAHRLSQLATDVFTVVESTSTVLAPKRARVG